MSDQEDIFDEEPPSINPYDVLGLARDATADQIKSAYRKSALKNHPDKVPPEKKEEAHATFQSIAFAYAVLSDPVRRKRYDTTGSTSEAIVDSEGFDWSDYYREQFKDAISTDAIEKFAAKYKGSDEEKDDLLIAYEQCEGDMDLIYETVMLSDVLQDDERFRKIIDEAIEKEDVPGFRAYTKESKKKRQARTKAAKAEAGEAEEYAKELGVHDKLFGGKKTKKGKGSSEDDLAALIQKRQQDRSANFLDHLAEKYGATAKKGKKSSKRGMEEEEEEPSEEAFQAAAAKLKSSKSSTGDKWLIWGGRLLLRNKDAMSSAPGAVVYPRYCFELAPTFDTWCFLRAADIHKLDEHDDGFEGEKFYFHTNLPIKWVRIVGVIVAIDEIAGRRFYTIDDSSGACIEVVVSISPSIGASEGGTRQNSAVPTVAATARLLPTNLPLGDIDVGVVVDVKGRLDSFREERQILVEKIKRIRNTAEEMMLWEKRTTFAREILGQPWVLRRRDIRRCRKEAQQSQETTERKRKRLQAVTGGNPVHGPKRPATAPEASNMAARNPTASELKEIIRNSAGLGTYNALGL
ncbi:hypothetical protein HJFPF1_08984 [Paramyrothecium foliicola]|nr:hypothetical protein HJFPF1_08984 [Paramyrothecium foliicola]